MDFLTRLTSGRPIVADGAMGTMLQAAGLPPGKTGEFWVRNGPRPSPPSTAPTWRPALN